MGLRASVFWRVAGILIGVQLATGLSAVALSAWFAYDRSLDLVANGLRLRLDVVAEEVERGAELSAEALRALPVPVRLDLEARFPDPVFLLDAAGAPIDTIAPNPEAFDAAIAALAERPPLPSNLEGLLAQGDIVISLDGGARSGTWGVAPLYDPDGFLVGGVLVQPLTNSRARELAGAREAYVQALLVVAGLGGVIALLLGAFFTWRLVKPLRRITRQVERLEAGDYGARLVAESDDEFGRLAAAINRMAGAVAESVETLQATDALRRELVANVGHDLRTPLAALLGYLEEAERYLQDAQGEAALGALSTATRQGAYLSRLIDDLFELSLLDAAQAPLHREPIPLAELLGDAALAHRPAFQKAGITFEVALEDTLPVVEGDGVRLLRLLDNLLGNARRHTAAGGTVRLEAVLDEDTACITVADTGAGIPPDTLPHVFDRYYRGGDARTRQGRSTGLGLAISRAIARAHSGQLTVESVVGTGSTFTLRLPLEAA